MGNSLTAPNNPQNFFFKNSSYLGAYVRKFYEKTKGQIYWENKTYQLNKSISHDGKWENNIYGFWAPLLKRYGE